MNDQLKEPRLKIKKLVLRTLLMFTTLSILIGCDNQRENIISPTATPLEIEQGKYEKESPPGFHRVRNTTTQEQLPDVQTFETIPEDLRAVHINPRNIKPAHARTLIEIAALENFNTLILRVTENMSFENAPWVVENPTWSLSDVIEVVDFARTLGMVVIPEVKLLTHQEKFLGSNFPEVMFNNVTYDPSNELVMSLVESFLDEVIANLSPSAIHIGHDEVAGHNARSATKWLLEGDEPLPAELFEFSVNHLKGYLDNQGIELWMWGDMLLGTEEFPDQNPRHLHGSLPGYGPEMRYELPKDISIVDWQYFEDGPLYRTLQVFRSEGFKVIGAVWDYEPAVERFTEYAANNGGSGMLLTTWGLVLPRDLESFQRLVTEAGVSFNSAFSDGNNLATNITPPSAIEQDFAGSIRSEVYSLTSAELFWDRATNNGSVQGYEIIRNGESLGVRDSLSLFESDLDPEEVYSYEITAIGTDGSSYETLTITLTTRDADVSRTNNQTTNIEVSPPTQTVFPGNIRHAVYSLTSAELFWDRATGNGFVQGYEIIRNGELLGVRDSLSLFEGELDPETLYTYEITAIDTDGNRSRTISTTFSTTGIDVSNNNNQLANSGSGTSPIFEANLRHQVYSQTSAELFWNRATDDGLVQGYEIIRNGESLGIRDSLSLYESTLDPAVVYTYTINAIDSEGNRSNTATISFTTDTSTF